MAEAYVPATLDDNGFTRGIAAQESGIYVDTISETYSDPKDFQMNNLGTRIGFIHNYDPEVGVSVTGEVDDTTSGIMTAVYGTAHSFTSSVLHGAEWGLTPGGYYLDGAVTNQGREAKKNIALDFISIPGLS